MTGCRIGRVRMKSGADITILHPAERRAEHADTLVRHAAEIASDPDLWAFVVIGVCSDGSYRMGSRIPLDGPGRQGRSCLG